MAQDAIWQTQKAVYAKLKADSGLMAIISDVYEYVPQGAVFPYVVITDIDSRPWFASSARGENISMEISVFSKERGNKNIIDIAAKVIAALHNTSFSITGHSLVNIRHQLTNNERLNDGQIYKSAIIFKIVTQEN